jgi:hypothetical protein
MKKLILVALTFLFAVGFTANAENKQTLTINGQVVEKLVTKITFDGDNVVLTFGDQSTQTADMSTVKLSFAVDGSTAIGTIKKEVENVLDINGLEPGTEVTIYDAQGKKMMSMRASEVRSVLNTSTLNSGVYLMKAGRQVVKFVKR